MEHWASGRTEESEGRLDRLAGAGREERAQCGEPGGDVDRRGTGGRSSKAGRGGEMGPMTPTAGLAGLYFSMLISKDSSPHSYIVLL